MFEVICSMENLLLAWREFRRGKRDRRDVRSFERHLEDELVELHNDLTSGAYAHAPYERFHIFDPKHRIIHKASVRDRVVHRAVFRVVENIFDRSFIYDSYSCRRKKGTLKAIERVSELVRRVSQDGSRPCWGLKCDIRKFFDSMNHDILLALLGKRIQDTETMRLLETIIRGYPSERAAFERGGSRGAYR